MQHRAIEIGESSFGLEDLELVNDPTNHDPGKAGDRVGGSATSKVLRVGKAMTVARKEVGQSRSKTDLGWT